MSKLLKGVFFGTMQQGAFVPEDKERWRKVVWDRNGLKTRVEIGPVPRDRSQAQVNYYWAGIIHEVEKWCGQPAEDIHDHLKEAVLRPLLGRRAHLPLPDGSHLNQAVSTSILTVEVMNEYIASCKNYVEREWNLTVPDIDSVPIRK